MSAEQMLQKVLDKFDAIQAEIDQMKVTEEKKEWYTITEMVEKKGFPRESLENLVRIESSPARQTSKARNAPWIIHYPEFVKWWYKHGGRV